MTTDPSTIEHAGGIVERRTRLADGRELIYFDDADTTLPAERAADARALDPRPATAEMRLDVLTGDWISVAAARQNRVFLPPAEADPLAPQSAANPSEVPSRYDVAVFENRSPSFGPETGPLDDVDGFGFERRLSSHGRCEVVCFSPDTTGSFAEQTTSRARTIVEAWAERTRELSAVPGIAQVFPFENRGEAIGVTLHHPHGQIYGYPYVTPRTRRLLEQIERSGLGPAFFERVLETERSADRVVLEGERFTAYVPFAARWPVELVLLPHRHIPDLAETTAAERDELATMTLALLRGIDGLYETPTPYIAAWHQAPVGAGRDRVRLRWEVTSPRRGPERLKYLAGSEAAMGAWIGDIPPETQAARLRSAIAGAA